MIPAENRLRTRSGTVADNHANNHEVARSTRWTGQLARAALENPWMTSGWALLTAILTFHLTSTGLFPVLETTEARYAEIARKMVELGNWVMPMYTYDMPFWGKPPLSFWLSAASIDVLGTNAFAARLPSWLLGAATLMLTWRVARTVVSREVALLAMIILASSHMGYEIFVSVRTDQALMFAVTLALTGFFLGFIDKQRIWYYAGFMGIGLGLLAKGPVALVLAGLPALVWLLIHGRVIEFIKDTRWLGGTTLMLVLALPWYIAAERQTPGFIEYFIVGEHWERYLVSGWTGDLYGSGHAEVAGTIWIFLVQALLPWSLALPVLAVARWRTAAGMLKAWKHPDPRLTFLVMWAVVPLLFFTFSRNITFAYIFPAFPAWSLIMALALYNLGMVRYRATLIFLALLLPLGKFTVNTMGDDWYTGSRNQKPVVQAYQRLNKDESAPLYYLGRRKFSAEFYNGGQISYVDSVPELPPQAVWLTAPRSTEVNACKLATTTNEYNLFFCARD